MERLFFGTSNGVFLIDWEMINGWHYRFETKPEMKPSSIKKDSDKGILVATGNKIQIPFITLFIKDSQPVDLDEKTTAEFMEFLKTRDMKVWTVKNKT